MLLYIDSQLFARMTVIAPGVSSVEEAVSLVKNASVLTKQEQDELLLYIQTGAWKYDLEISQIF